MERLSTANLSEQLPILPSLSRSRIMLTLLGVTACSGSAPAEATSPTESTLHTAPAKPISVQTVYIPTVQEVQEEEIRKIRERPCSSYMVNVDDEFCIDRYEAFLMDANTVMPMSPYYTPDPKEGFRQHLRWIARAGKTGRYWDAVLQVPEYPEWQMKESFDLGAYAVEGKTPNGYLTQAQARSACEKVGKRLCTADEWVKACRSENDTDHPYGDEYQPEKCNIQRGEHPSRAISGDAGRYHDDPRLHLVEYPKGKTLLQPTGSYPECVSKWGDDGIYDMVGNLDEWVESENGRGFRGGFYSRYGEKGCSISHGGHAENYYDYSIGVRCCDEIHQPTPEPPRE